MLMYNRLRASIHMDYMPLFDPDASAERSAKWYAKWWDERQQAKKLKKSSWVALIPHYDSVLPDILSGFELTAPLDVL